MYEKPEFIPSQAWSYAVIDWGLLADDFRSADYMLLPSIMFSSFERALEVAVDELTEIYISEDEDALTLEQVKSELVEHWINPETGFLSYEFTLEGYATIRVYNLKLVE